MTETIAKNVWMEKDRIYAELLDRIQGYGLKLRMSEAVRLRKILEKCMEEGEFQTEEEGEEVSKIDKKVKNG